MTWDIWETDYNSDNWDPEFITIFVAWQLRVKLDSIRNSCDVLFETSEFLTRIIQPNWKFADTKEKWSGPHVENA